MGKWTAAKEAGRQCCGRAIDNRPYAALRLLASMPEHTQPGRKVNVHLRTVEAVINCPHTLRQANPGEGTKPE